MLAEPLDLSAASGLYIDCAADSDADARVHKVSVRTAQDRGEQVYQSVFVPPAGGPRSTLRVPFDDFRLVRGARLVPDAPPLGPSLNATYQVSLTVSKFGIAETMSPLEGFKEGPFSLRLYEIGAYSEGGAAPAAALPPVLEDADKKVPSSAPAAIRALRFVLGPALALAWRGAPPPRRRAAAREARPARSRDPLRLGAPPRPRERGRRRRARGEAGGLDATARADPRALLLPLQGDRARAELKGRGEFRQAFRNSITSNRACRRLLTSAETRYPLVALRVVGYAAARRCR